MKLTTYGTSHGVPEKDRMCNCNMLEVGGELYIVDCGAPIAELLRRDGYDFAQVRAVFVTHPHADHLAFVTHLACLADWYFKKADFDLYLPDEESMNYAASLMKLGKGADYENPRVCFHVYRDGEVYRDGKVVVTAYPSGHCKNAHSLWFDAEGKSALFTGDLDADYFTLTPRAFTDRTAFTLIECAHQSLGAVLATFPKIKTDSLIVTHIGYILPIERVRALSARLRCIVARDNDTFGF